MKTHPLKAIRVVGAVLCFVVILAYFVDFKGFMPAGTVHLLRFQLIPALLSVSVVTVAFLLLFTLLFGRWYCSTLCPTGVLEDIFIRLTKRLRKKKRKKVFVYHRPHNWLRYSLLAVALILLAAGSNQLLSWSDPYSNFGRMASQLFYPAVIGANNFAADVAMKMGYYSLYHLSVGHVVVSSFLLAVAVFLLLLLMSALRGRLFCHTLCPVGTLLSIFARFSLFRVRFDKEACNSCGMCEHSCKSECIDSRNKTIDASRCVNCFNCLSACRKGGLRYAFATDRKEKTVSQTAKVHPADNSRRSFMATGIGLVGSIPLISSCRRGNNDFRRTLPVTPPGSLSLQRFETKCTACHICVVKCPSHILKPAGMQYGFNYFLKPFMHYDKSYCNYECKVCTEVCPNGALKTLTVEEKVTSQIGVVRFNPELCVVTTDRQDCGACSEHCPTQAVKMVPFEGDLRIPQTDPSICVGCGGCECICPVRPNRAIVVVANEVHLKINRPEYEKVEDVEVNDFGF